VQIDMTGIRALIFDFDGTLADTMPAHYASWQETLAPYGILFPIEEFYALGGWPSWRIVKRLSERSGIAVDVREVSRRKNEHFLQCMHLVRPVEPVAAIARAYAGKLPMAIATGGVAWVTRPMLAQIGLADLFPVVVTSEDVERHKPDPDVFLLAASRLGVEPGACLVFEDTDPGVEAARRAGMRFVDVREIVGRPKGM